MDPAEFVIVESEFATLPVDPMLMSELTVLMVLLTTSARMSISPPAVICRSLAPLTRLLMIISSTALMVILPPVVTVLCGLLKLMGARSGIWNVSLTVADPPEAITILPMARAPCTSPLLASARTVSPSCDTTETASPPATRMFVASTLLEILTRPASADR